MRISQKKVEELVREVSQNFRSFGGGEVTFGNPLSAALKDEPAQFAAGVDIKEVVEFILKRV